MHISDPADTATKAAQALPGLDRRSLIAGAMVGTAAAVAAPAFAAKSVSRLDPSNPADARQIIRKLRYRTDEGMVFWWIDGVYMANVDAVLTPLYGMCFGALQMVKQRGDGGFDVTQMELGFRTELDTGKRMRTFVNPLTNQSMPAPFNPIGPTTVHYSPDAVPSVPRDLGGSQIDFRAFPEKPFVAQDQVFVQYRAQSHVQTAGMADRTINDISMIYGPAAQALDPGCTSVDAWLHSSDIASFPRWMNMGNRPGNITLRGVGAKVKRISDMPKNWLAMMEEYDPAILADPEAALRRNPLTYKG